MLWLGLYFPDLPLNLFSRGLPDDAALAVFKRQRGIGRIVRCNAAARQAGLRPGLSVSAALALRESLRLAQRDLPGERRALQELAAWAYQYSPQIAFEPAMLLLEIGRSLRLFGGRTNLLARLEQELTQLGYPARWGSAPTPIGAGLLARSRHGCHADTPRTLRALIDDLPLHRLTRHCGTLELLRDIGLTSIGDCLSLPRPELLRRTNPALGLLLDRLLGHQPDPRPHWQPPKHFSQRLDLLAEINHRTALLFPARRLITALCAFLRGLDATTQQLEWTLHYREHSVPIPPARFVQGLLRPQREPEPMLALLREYIERLRLAAPVVAIALRVEHWQPFSARSPDLFGADEASSDLSLVDRLSARLGEQRVRGLQTQAEHRPEKAWRYCPPREPGEPPGPGAARPLWLLAQPLPMTDSAGVPQREKATERIEAGWWDGQDISRDYYLTTNRSGERLWIYHDRRSRQWFLHGLFD